jgi:hypothetical protein
MPGSDDLDDPIGFARDAGELVDIDISALEAENPTDDPDNDSKK